MWEAIKEYYTTIGIKYHVDPVIFLGIHIVATPLFIIASAWIVKKYKKRKSVFLPALIAVFLFNAANIYLITFGKNIPWFIYFILAITCIITGYFSYIKIKNKLYN
ncbi:MAG: hypothetical protein H7098_13710 [Oligoflexus sp.]|nr:hypothetical protein [Pseudopedobacter sp.]